MSSVHEKMLDLINRCDICLDGNVISKELLTKSYYQFLSYTIEKEKHNIEFVLHTGSNCFDAIILSYLVISNIFYNETKPDDLVHSLYSGDMVLYKKQRYVFIGFAEDIKGSLSEQPIVDDGEYVILKQNNSYTAVRKPNWNKIMPYQGKSKRLDGRGIRKGNNKRNLFLTSILEIAESDIPSTIDVSSVVVMPKEASYRLIQGISFKCKDLEIFLTELVPISYFTDGDSEYPYGGNAAKVEPVIKICSKISVARKLLLQRDFNKNIGLVVLGDEMIQKSHSELAELIERKSIQYVYICASIGTDAVQQLVKKYEEAGVFACTKDFLLSNSMSAVEKNELTDYLYQQIDTIIDHEIEPITVDGGISWKDYVSFKRSVFQIKSSDYESDEKDKFIIQAFSLFNLYISSFFTMKSLENSIEKGIVQNVDSPLQRLATLKEVYKRFPEYLKESASKIINILSDNNERISNQNPKGKALLQLLINNQKKKICIIVPKAYYIELMRPFLQGKREVYVTTFNKFDNDASYDLIVCLGSHSGRRFDVFKNKSALKTIVLLYASENGPFKQKKKNSVIEEKALNQRSTFEVFEDEFEYEEKDEESQVVEEVEKIDIDINTYITAATVRTARTFVDGNQRGNKVPIRAIAKFDTGELAFLTKNYKAYLLEKESLQVREVSVENLAEGDTIIFTRSNSKTRDIVDELLQELIKANKLSSPLIEAYQKSKIWKRKLVEFMNKEDLSPAQIAKRMINNGTTVQEITIRGWLDEDSHTVGPRNVESIEQIGLVINDESMFINTNDYFVACATVRRLRRRILDAIATATLAKVTGNEINQDSVISTVSEQIDDLAVVLSIENVFFTTEMVPVNIINRPVFVGMD